MLATLRREYAGLVTSGTQLFLLILGIQFQTRTVWLGILGAIALISLFAWVSALRRLRIVRDTPTSRIASAAQGYVELCGRGKPVAEPMLSKLSLLPCLWYRYLIERRDSDNKWHTEDKGESEEPFLLDDGSGRCMVDPRGAEILTRHKDSWHKDNYRYTEWKLIDLDSLYLIGRFRTVGGSSVVLDANEEIKAVLAEWKQDMGELRKRFDLDNNGEIDMREWMLARQAAKREAEKRMDEVRAQPDFNIMEAPQDGRLFLISNLPQEGLERRYWFWTWAHLFIFFAALGGLSWLFGHA